MKWAIPAKTFLLGEYVALAGGPAIILTTTPCFELSLSHQSGLQSIHKASPAGRWWAMQNLNKGLQWFDPYHGRGGMGASSAQFVGAYLASLTLQQKKLSLGDLLEAYLKSAWSGEGVAPSGYDVLAQVLYGCVYINKTQGIYQQYTWPFKDVGFLLLHTGKKLATHEHLEQMVVPQQTANLAAIVDKAKEAFEKASSYPFVAAINAYYEALIEMNLVALHTSQHVASFKKRNDILAVKGCGALGADVILLIVPIEKQDSISEELANLGWIILANTYNLHRGPSLIEKNDGKRLEF
jgi:mevalonate kinase